MPKQKLTPWFSGNHNPARSGLYQVIVWRGPGNVYPSETELKFNGVHWSHTPHSSNGEFSGSYARMTSKDKWRGLAEEPKVKP